MSLSSKISALRNLAERPGTEAEGIVARKMLKRLEEKNSGPLPEGDRWDYFREFLKHGRMEDLDRATGRNIITRCACGNTYVTADKCRDLDRHEAYRIEIRNRFPVGTRVHYSAWAYPLNCPGKIIGKSRDSSPWNWYSVKFDHLKSSRSVPVLTEEGWRLSTDLISEEAANLLGWRKF